MNNRARKALLTAQAVGAYGERVVEAELLRNQWIAANVNASVKNAADFDIYAVKGDCSVQLRVKTCGPGVRTFQYGFPPGQEVSNKDIGRSDFTILVSMGDTRDGDEFFVVPTRKVRQVLAEHRAFYLGQTRKDGAPRKDTGHWSLRLFDRKDGKDPGYGLEKKWRNHKCNWLLLEREAKKRPS